MRAQDKSREILLYLPQSSTKEDEIDREIISNAPIQYRDGRILLKPILDFIKRIGYQMDNSMISYYDTSFSCWVYVGNYPLQDGASLDPDALPARDVPPFNAWSASGVVFGAVVDAGYGLRADFERLIASGIDLDGTVALARYGRSYRGVKAQLAEEFGCAAVLLFNDPGDSGAERGEVWPNGPWKAVTRLSPVL